MSSKILDLSSVQNILQHRRKFQKPINPTSNEVLFKGLCAVVALLCQLDEIDNVMDYSKIFEQEKGVPTYHLKMILA